MTREFVHLTLGIASVIKSRNEIFSEALFASGLRGLRLSSEAISGELLCEVVTKRIVASESYVSGRKRV